VAKTYRLNGGRKAFNSLLKGLIALGIPTGDIYVLTVTGRRSGLPRSTPVAPMTHDGKRWLVSPYGEVGWVQNARAAGRARLTRARQTEDVRLREATPAEAGPVLKKYLEQNQRIVGPFFDVKPGDPVERFVAEAAKHPVFEVVAG
jgi:deazaflavin-dependent oxidoreductase (nitroreductase family)